MSKKSYDKQIKELETIVAEIESGELSIDQLANKVQLATDLVKACKEQLTSVEDKVNSILEIEK
ncbi:MAG: exodeoxyribonuclease VII small subunit [bacterium]